MKRTRLKKKTSVSAEKIRQKCVTKAKYIVRFLANFTCAYCGKSEPQVKTHGSHCYEEGTYRSMSADLENILCLCFTHHLGIWNAKEPSWHGSPLEMTEWFREKYPERYAALKEKSHQNIQADTFYWTKKLDDLTELEKQLGI